MNGSVFKQCPCTRANGAGTGGSCTKKHGSWTFVHDLPSPVRANGERPRLKRGGYPTRKAANAALIDSLAQCRQRGVAAERDMEGRRQFLAAYLTEWLAGRPKLKPATRKFYEAQINLYLIPHLGHLRLEEIGAGHLEAMYAELRQPRRRGAIGANAERMATAKQRKNVELWRLSPASILRTHATLRKALNDAVKRRILDFNPATFVELESVRSPKTRYWTHAQAGQFLDSIVGDELYELYLLALHRGPRRGELVALQWDEDLDLDEKLLTIQRNVVVINYKLVEGTPKSETSERVLSLDDDTVEDLREHRKRQGRLRRELGYPEPEIDLVFCKPDGRPLHPEYVSRHFDVLVKRAGLPRIKFHELRHTAASLMLEAGAELKYVQYVLGHADITITGKIYAHVTRRLDRRLSAQIAGAIPRQNRRAQLAADGQSDDDRAA